MKETDIIDPVRIGKFSLGYFRWSVTAHIFQPKRFWKYCTKQVYEWKRGLFLQFISLTVIYTLFMFIFHSDGYLFINDAYPFVVFFNGRMKYGVIDVYFPYGRPAVHYIKRCTNAYLARIFHLYRQK